MPPAPWRSAGGEALKVLWRHLPGLLTRCGGSAAVFEALHGSAPLQDTFWLDRYSVMRTHRDVPCMYAACRRMLQAAGIGAESGCRHCLQHLNCSAATDRARFSYFGGPGGPLWQRLTYHLQPGVPHGSLRIQNAAGEQTTQQVSEVAAMVLTVPMHSLPCAVGR